MHGLTQSYIFKQKLQNCEPIDFSSFVVHLRERHLEYWTPYFETHPREHNSKRPPTFFYLFQPASLAPIFYQLSGFIEFTDKAISQNVRLLVSCVCKMRENGDNCCCSTYKKNHLSTFSSFQPRCREFAISP